MPTSCAEKSRHNRISDIWTRWRFPSAARNIVFGVPLTRTAAFSTRLSRPAAIPSQPKRLLVRVLKKQGLSPKRIVSDKLRSYGAARRDVMPGVEHRSHKGLNNRAENSHVPLRKRERMMQGFRSVGGLQRFPPVFSAVRNLFVPSHQKRSALATHIHRIRAMAHWKVVTGATA